MHMNKKYFLWCYYLYTVLICFMQHSYANETVFDTWEKQCWFDTTFLRDPKRVRMQLKKEGFVYGRCVTADKLSLEYLFLAREQSTCTVVVCAGWLPGVLEGMTPLYALLPSSCNILFFNARGRGKSDSTCQCIYSFGKHEYKDIIAIIERAHELDDKPIIIYGTCAGAFHAAHALVTLELHERIADLGVIGFVFDSGWASVVKTAASVIPAFLSDTYVDAFKLFMRLSRQQLKETCPVRVMNWITSLCCGLVHRVFFAPFVNDHATNLYEKISTISIPIFYIHSCDDDYVAIEEVQKLAQNSQRPWCWWITKQSRHACHFLKHKRAYRDNLAHFIQMSVQNKNAY